MPTLILLLLALPWSAAPPATEPGLHPLMKPVEITSTFGMQRNPATNEVELHRGIDFLCPVGTPVHATDYGRVQVSGTNRGYGTYIIIEHEDGFETRYAHLSSAAVSVGDVVLSGDRIGASGNSGLSSGPHLHYEIWKDGEPVDPMHYLPAQ